MTDWVSRFSSNCFQQAITGLNFEKPQENGADLFSRGCVEFFQEKDFETYGYQFTQIFEENILNEVIFLNKLPAEDVYAVRSPQSDNIKRLRDFMSNADDLSNPALANTIAALVSISRFRAASSLLKKMSRRKLNAHSAFELGWLEFLISNRFQAGRTSQAAFDRMRSTVKSGAIPAGRVLDLCTQGVVWYLKRREIDDITFKWCLTTGTRLVSKTNYIDFGTMSNWFRGLAMLPAARQNFEITREYMEHACKNATLSIAKEGSIKSANSLKTYYESSIKECLYVKPDRELAINAAKKLIALDPTWSPSYGELAEIYSRFGQHTIAAIKYESAAALGPPYFGRHLLMAARSWAKAGEINHALENYTYLISLIPDDTALRAEANACGYND